MIENMTFLYFCLFKCHKQKCFICSVTVSDRLAVNSCWRLVLAVLTMMTGVKVS